MTSSLSPSLIQFFAIVLRIVGSFRIHARDECHSLIL